MTKQDARKILMLEAKVHKRLDYDAVSFKEKLKNRNKNLDEGTLEAYDLIKDELVHILALVWGWER